MFPTLERNAVLDYISSFLAFLCIYNGVGDVKRKCCVASHVLKF